MRGGGTLQIVAQPDQDCGECDHQDASYQHADRLAFSPFPLLQVKTPQITRDDDEGHMQRPTGEIVVPHFGGTHAIEHKL